MRKCIPRDFLEYFTRLLSYDITVTRERPKESYRGRLLISSYFGDNFEIVSVVSKEIVCGGLQSGDLRIIILLLQESFLGKNITSCLIN